MCSMRSAVDTVATEVLVVLIDGNISQGQQAPDSLLVRLVLTPKLARVKFCFFFPDSLEGKTLNPTTKQANAIPLGMCDQVTHAHDPGDFELLVVMKPAISMPNTPNRMGCVQLTMGPWWSGESRAHPRRRRL